ncbi:MAG: hypothetical protein GF310_06905, partial [candidate division Zixibacteria bacterium]|nr:hypothetical protein [candidate division Zixibacteria bacterium]
TYQTARNSFYEMMFGQNHPYAKVPLGMQRTVATIGADNLKAYHKRFYAPNNMILTVCTNLELDWVLSRLEETFGQMDRVSLGKIEIPAPNPPSGIVKSNTPMDKEQVYIYLGAPTIGINHPDYAALDVATEILSSRLSLELREVQGLAYSVGAGLATSPDFGWFVVSMGTGTNNYQVAYDGILAEINKMQTAPVSEAELRKAVNSIWGSSLTRQLSRINQAYYMTLYEFMGTGYDYKNEYMEQVKAVTVDDILSVAAQYLPSQDYYLATVGLQ